MGVGQLGEMSRVILCGSATTRVRRGSSAIALLALLLALTCGTAAAAAEAPVNTKVPTISGSGSAKEGKVLTANPGKWSGTVETYSYQWQRCTSPSACANIPSATNIEYTPQSTDVGYTLLVSVVAHGPGGPSGESKPALSAQTSEVAGVAPKNTKALEIVGKVENGQPLEVINSQEDWSGTPATKFTYLWESWGAKK